MTDLENALNSSKPMWTQDDFSYKINAPSQKVSHHLWSMHHKFEFDSMNSLQILWGTQYNVRNEFDIIVLP